MLISAGFKRYFTNTSWLIVEKLLRMVVAVFVGMYVARYLGPHQFGALSYANSFVILFLPLVSLGLDRIVVRELVKYPDRKEEILGTTFWLKFAGTLLMWVGLLLVVPFTDNNPEQNILIAILAFAVIFQTFNTIGFQFEAEVKSKYVVHIMLIQVLCSAVIKLILVYNEASLIWFALVFLIDALILSMGLIYQYLKEYKTFFNLTFRPQIARNLLKNSIWLIMSAALNAIYMRIDQVMIMDIRGVQDVGMYAASVQLSESIFGLSVVVCNSLFPAIVNAREVSQQYFLEKIYALFRVLVFFMIIVGVLASVFSEEIIVLLYGEKFLPAAEVLSVMIWCGIFISLGVVSGRWHIAEGLMSYGFYRNIVGVLVNVVLNIIFIKQYGIVGAAYASLIAYIFAFLLFDLFYAKARHIFILKIKSILLLR